MRHFAPACVHLAAPAPTKMRALLESRKTTLEAMVRERHRQSREHHKPADVKMLLATLRAVKHQLGVLDARAPSATHEGLA